MQKLMMSVAAVALLATAVPAGAQTWGGYYQGAPMYGFRYDVPVHVCGDGDGDEREDYAIDGGYGQRRLHAWIGHAQSEGRLNWWEARRLHDRVNQVAGWEARVCSKGYANEPERQRVMQAYRGVAADIWREIHEHEVGSYRGWGWWRW